MGHAYFDCVTSITAVVIIGIGFKHSFINWNGDIQFAQKMHAFKIILVHGWYNVSLSTWWG